MLDVLRFWLDLGIDGFRLDAVPYLFEEEATNCENLPRTHEFFKSDVVECFGDPEIGGDEAHRRGIRVIIDLVRPEGLRWVLVRVLPT